jgi:hypothetical protein
VRYRARSAVPAVPVAFAAHLALLPIAAFLLLLLALLGIEAFATLGLALLAVALLTLLLLAFLLLSGLPLSGLLPLLRLLALLRLPALLALLIRLLFLLAAAGTGVLALVSGLVVHVNSPLVSARGGQRVNALEYGHIHAAAHNRGEARSGRAGPPIRAIRSYQACD